MGSLPNLHELAASYPQPNWQDKVLGKPAATTAVAFAAVTAAAIIKSKEMMAGASKEDHKMLAKRRSLGSDRNARIAESPFLPGKTSRNEHKWSLANGQRRSRCMRSSSVTACHSSNASVNGGGVGGEGTFGHCCTSRQASVSSSTGTSSVRKLIAVVRSTPSHLGPVYSRPLICQNFVALCLSHSLLTIAFVPIIVLEGSISAWSSSSSSAISGFKSSVSTSSSSSPSLSLPTSSPTLSPLLSATTLSTWTRHSVVPSNVGSLLVALLYLAAAGAAPISAFVNRRLGVTRSLSLGWLVATLFIGAHLYPRLSVLVPAYVLMGVALGHMDNARTTYMIQLACKLKLVPSEEEECEFQSKLESTKHESLVHKLYRGMSFAHNFGLMAGGALGYALIRLTATYSPAAMTMSRINHLASGGDGSGSSYAFTAKEAAEARICGYESCPWDPSLLLADTYVNRTLRLLMGGKSGGGGVVASLASPLPCKTTAILAGVFLGCCAVATLVNAMFVHQLRTGSDHLTGHASKFENAARTLANTFNDSKLKVITPLLLFIGVEQAFMYADFTKVYVICAMGVENAPLIFIGLGILQFVASVTVSLLVHHVRKYLIVGVGVVFQGCLLLVLIVWKPTSEDAALFYVISAAWGVCNAIWDTLTFCLLVSSFPDNWEFPFSHNFFFRYLGLWLAFSIHGFLCTSVKLYIMCAMLLVAVLPYTWLEIKLDSLRSTRKGLVHNWHR